jgi:hypothetical protein
VLKPSACLAVLGRRLAQKEMTVNVNRYQDEGEVIQHLPFLFIKENGGSSH